MRRRAAQPPSRDPPVGWDCGVLRDRGVSSGPALAPGVLLGSGDGPAAPLRGARRERPASRVAHPVPGFAPDAQPSVLEESWFPFRFPVFLCFSSQLLKFGFTFLEPQKIAKSSSLKKKKNQSTREYLIPSPLY